ncbi:MAG: hypothetical protein LBT01_02125 [Spirochaetaceae bacterium]|nr:hypothetical protein [Spirochaetaceae bacterium]
MNNLTNKISKFVIGSVSLIVLALALVSCEALASTAGQNLSPETVWIRLTPSKAALVGGTLTATSKAMPATRRAAVKRM